MALLAEIHERLVIAGLPIRGLSHPPNGTITIDWLTPPTPAQSTTADQIITQATSEPNRRLKSLIPLVQELFAFVNVPAGQPAWVNRLARVACLAAAEALRRDPKLARRVGEAIDGDEPDV